MANRPSTPEIITVNSERLQSLVRDLLPSQNGFGSELQASNVITPIIDLTATAEGSTLRSDLQTALAFGSVTPHSVANNTVTIVNTPGFWRIYGNASATVTGSNLAGTFELTDGLSTKVIWQANIRTGSGTTMETYDFIVWLSPGESLVGLSNSLNIDMLGCSRQIADSTGAFVNPAGFPV